MYIAEPVEKLGLFGVYGFPVESVSPRICGSGSAHGITVVVGLHTPPSMGVFRSENAQGSVGHRAETSENRGWGRVQRMLERLELECQVHTPPSNSRPSGKQVIDPGQTSFDLGPMPAPAVPLVSAPHAGEPVLAPKRKSKGKPGATVVRRDGPRRARISFEAPIRLNRKLERIAGELDRSKTALLREALEAHLKDLDTTGAEA
jgi:hypothetical protein